MGGGGQNSLLMHVGLLITVMLIYRQWVIMACSEKLSDTIFLEKFKVYTTKKANIAFALA